MTGFMKPLSKEIKEKLYELVGDGVSSVNEMRRHLRSYVDKTLFCDTNRPAITDAAYYPTDGNIRKHIYLAQQRLRYAGLNN